MFILKQKAKKFPKIRILLAVWGFFVILAGLIVEAALIIPEINDVDVEGSQAECPGEYRSGFINGSFIPEVGGFWGHYWCEGQTGWEPCNTGGTYSAVKPVFDPNFCGMQQIDYHNEEQGIDWFESCLITDCAEPPAPPPPPPPPPPPTSNCPYNTTEARVQCTPWQSCPWQSALSLNNGATFRIGGFRNGADTPPCTNCNYTVTAPNGSTVLTCNVASGGDPYSCLGREVVASQAGQYTLRITTPGFNDPRCEATAVVNITSAPSQAPEYQIEKSVLDADTVYNIGETANFGVTIRNTGDVSFDVVAFRDVYNPARLDYLSARGNRNGGADVALSFSVNESTGIITHSDLTSELGNLAPGDFYQLTFSFRALARVSRTCNEAFVNPDSLGEINDDACVAINEVPIPTPDL